MHADRRLTCRQDVLFGQIQNKWESLQKNRNNYFRLDTMKSRRNKGWEQWTNAKENINREHQNWGETEAQICIKM